MLEFASDGESILYSSGAMDGSDGEFAPDLWRYHPSTDEPELLWRNPRRDRSLVKIGGEFGTWAFVDMPLSGEIAWDLLAHPRSRCGSDPARQPPRAGHAPRLRAELPRPPGPGGLDGVRPRTERRGPVSAPLRARAGLDPGRRGRARCTPGRAVVPIVARHAARLLRGHLLRRSHDRRAPRVPRGRRPPGHPSTAARHLRPGDHADPAHQRRRGLEGGRSRIQHVQLGNDVPLRRGDRRGHPPADAAAGVRELPDRPARASSPPGARTPRRSASTTWTWTSRGSSIAGPAETNISILRPHNSWELLVWLEAEIPGDDLGQVRFAFLPSAGTDRDRDRAPGSGARHAHDVECLVELVPR